VLSCLILIIIVLLFADGLQKKDLTWKGWIFFPLGMGLFGLVTADCLYHGVRSKACARCDLVLEHHPLRFDALPAATSAAVAGDVEELTELAQRGELVSSSNLWLCQGCQEVGIIELPQVHRVLRGSGLEQLASKVRPAPP
jgi:hypothetical protein